MSIKPISVQKFISSSIPAANVSSINQRSLLRYPGGKTWLVPHIKEWLKDHVNILIEPFVGGGIVSLTAVMDNLAQQALMIDLDRDISSFWRAILEHPQEMIERIQTFNPTRTNVKRIACEVPETVQDQGFRALVLNRTRRGGILAPGASFIKNGENGNGICSRWYPDTLIFRLQAIAKHSSQFSFYEGDGVHMLELLCSRKGVAFFIDPPYTVSGGKRTGSRLYFHNTVDHDRIFAILAKSDANFLMTYNHSPEVIELVRYYGFEGAVVEMKNTNHSRIAELVITRNKLF